jgi:dihydrofolate reductase
MANYVFVATSLDGYIAQEDGGLDWLNELPAPSDGDGGFSAFIDSIDAIVMGRKTFEKVQSFDIPWPYSKKVFVLSKTLNQVRQDLRDKVEIIQGEIPYVIKTLNQRGFERLYVDGGKTIQSFLNEQLIDEMTISLVPVILGKGIPLFDQVPNVKLQLLSSMAFGNGLVQARYRVLK